MSIADAAVADGVWADVIGQPAVVTELRTAEVVDTVLAGYRDRMSLGS